MALFCTLGARQDPPWNSLGPASRAAKKSAKSNVSDFLSAGSPVRLPGKTALHDSFGYGTARNSGSSLPQAA
jgi:hypothetical protein